MSVTFKTNLLILQYNINNSRTKTMISLFENKKNTEVRYFDNSKVVTEFHRFHVL